MIRTLRIRNLKSVKEIALDCRDINLLTGDNLSGKSTVFDALRIEGLMAMPFPDTDILKEDNMVRHGEKMAEVSLTDTEGNTVDVFLSEEKAGLLNEDNGVISRCSTIRNIRCIRAWDPAAAVNRAWGSFCLSYKEGFSEEVNSWLERIIGTRLDFKERQDSQLPGALNGCVSHGAVLLAELIVFCLSTPEGAVLYIENPEAGLSPRAQSELGRFLYHVAGSGRQLFVETHSDHIFNSLRVGIVKGSMDAEKIAVDFFRLKDGETKCLPVEIDRYGNVFVAEGDTLDGFFDQFDKDLDAMLGL